MFNLSVIGQGYNSGSFVGQIIDSASRQAISGATVTFKNRETGFQSGAKTDQDGKFSRPSMPPGVYDIEAKADGYIPKSTSLPLYATRSNDVIPVPIELDKVVTVTGNAEPKPSPSVTPTPDGGVDTGPVDIDRFPETINLNPQREGRFGETEVPTLPLGGSTLTRTFDELALLIPGVAPAPQAIGNTVGPGIGGGVGTSGQFAVNGLRSRSNNFTVDGSDNNDEDIGVRRQGFFSLVPQPIESIKEFSIITLLAPAEFGRNLGAQVNAISKSGTNQFNGTFFGFFNSDKLNARNYFDNASGDSTTPLQAMRVSGELLPVFVENKEIQVTNDAGEKDSSTLLQGGFAIGGRIIRNKMFFFASGEGQLLNAVQERHFAVPTVEERGLFGTGAQGLTGSTVNGTYPLFPTSITGESIFSLFPFPNDPKGIYDRNTYTQTLSSDARGRILSGKIGYTFFQDTERPQALTTRYNYTDDKRDLTDVGGALFSAIRPLVRNDNFTTFLEGGLTDKITNEFRFSWGRTQLQFEEIADATGFIRPISKNRFDSSQDTRFLLNAAFLVNTTIPSCPGGAAFCSSNDIILPTRATYLYERDAQGNIATTENTDIGLIGQLNVAGFSPVGVDVFNFPQERVNNTFQIADTMRWQLEGGHNLSFGSDIRRTFLDSNLQRNSRPLVTFNGGITTNSVLINRFGPLVKPIDLVASGAATGFFQSIAANGKNADIKLSYNQLNFFIQDEWRARSNLNFNFGLRYEYNTTPREADRKIEETFSTAFPAFLSGFSQFIEGRTKIYEADVNNFAPRIGLAYSPTSRTVIRGGFGMYYDQILGAVVSQSRNVYPTFTTANFGGGSLIDNAIGNLTQFTIFNPSNAVFSTSGNIVVNCLDFPEVNACNSSNFIRLLQPGSLNTFNSALTQQQLRLALQDIFNIFPGEGGGSFGATLPKKDLDTPFSYQYSIGIERELLDNTFLSIAYVGTTGRSLLRFTTPNLGSNYIADLQGFFFLPDDCEKDIAFCEPLGFGTTRSPSRSVANVGSINRFETTGRSRYDSLQFNLRGRLTRHFQYQANYVFGKVKDDVSDVFDLAGAFALPQNSLTFGGEYAPANFDVRHRITYNFVYDTPSFNDRNNVLKYFLGGWQIAGTGKFSSGQPFTVNSIFDVNLDGNLTDRLNNTAGIIQINDRRRPLILNGNPRSMLADIGEDGAVQRNSFRAGNIMEVDLSFAKKFRTRETQSLQFRIDIFNIINRANFGIPVRFLESPSFGEAVDTVTPGRRIQLALKYNF